MYNGPFSQRPGRHTARVLPWLLLLYGGASLLHFMHNAAYIAAYPNLPRWISGASIAIAWCAISAIGLTGYLLVRRGLELPGLAVLAVYTMLWPWAPCCGSRRLTSYGSPKRKERDSDEWPLFG